MFYISGSFIAGYAILGLLFVEGCVLLPVVVLKLLYYFWSIVKMVKKKKIPEGHSNS